MYFLYKYKIMHVIIHILQVDIFDQYHVIISKFCENSKYHLYLINAYTIHSLFAGVLVYNNICIIAK